MDKKGIIVTILGMKPNAQLSPVQIQKILFLIDKNIGNEIGGPFFDFIPYHYGPFDQNIYNELDELTTKGDVEKIRHNLTRYHFRISETGLIQFKDLTKSIDTKILDYIKNIVDWATAMTFIQLVSAIYKAYPEMKENSVFKDL